MALRKVEHFGDIVVSRYKDLSFAHANELVTVEIYEDDKLISKTVEPRPIADQEALKQLLGDAAVTQREQVTDVEARIASERQASETRLTTMQDRLQNAEREARAAREVIRIIRSADAEWNTRMEPLLKAVESPELVEVV